jgi:hypothetical protein
MQFLATRHAQPLLAGIATAAYVVALVFGGLTNCFDYAEDDGGVSHSLTTILEDVSAR